MVSVTMFLAQSGFCALVLCQSTAILDVVVTIQFLLTEVAIENARNQISKLGFETNSVEWYTWETRKNCIIWALTTIVVIDGQH